ncbi:RNA polymerase sigma factor [Phytohabitans rumicis]|uniref:DNA-directed RNA polymerase sigma-70 factor n=1 Tax=Phytohabitans rumicis TaxID=1076125 RepID=A0A6V8LBL9_9ACTN|nr:RNA polymerase sigma factor [Phytohabitans rumicis]GFJ91476.1 DNA-directed RNA polymerase sigma-70 factor [Phytohabitans rumicis]
MEVAEAPIDLHAPPDLAGTVLAAQAGDESAFLTVYRTLQPVLMRYLRVLVGDDADDVASEAWLQIARDLGGFRGDWDKFRGWAVTIARHRAMDHLRSARRRPSVAAPVEHFADLTGTEDTVEAAMESVGTSAAIALIGTLPRDQAEAVLLRVVVGLDAETAGRVLGKRAGAVRTAAYRGLRRLAEQLGASERAGAAASGLRSEATREGGAFDAARANEQKAL